ncbi:MAG: YkgJ family cysteine cluster protein [Candidatus Omnitrophica bacterium]|nr:YkgJ family cysteine cluster protein [Candidatus Omnitrophota bacterium]
MQNKPYPVFSTAWLLILKSSHYPEKIDKTVHSLYKQISSKIDCTNCGNCCKLIKPVLSKKDIEKLSKSLGVGTDKVIKDFLIEDKKEGGFIFNISG